MCRKDKHTEGGKNKNNMEEKSLLVILGILLVIGFIAQGVIISNIETKGISEEKMSELISVEISKIPAPVDQDPIVVPTAAEIAAEIKVDSADNALLNEFLESQYESVFDEIKFEAEDYAIEELSDHNYKVVVDYLMSWIESIDEDSIDNEDEEDRQTEVKET